MPVPSVAVVVLNWNGKALLERFLPAVLLHTPADAEVVVVDNGSTDASLLLLQESFPGVKVVALDKNHGFAGGYNRGLAQLTADYFVLLNSDVLVTDGWLEPCIALLESNPDVVACQPNIRSLTSPSSFDYAGAAGGFVDILGYPFCRGRLFDHIEKDDGQYDFDCEIGWATGAALCIQSGPFFEAGGFDESFFAHMEEVDLCWRLQIKGYRLMACSSAVVFHQGAASLPTSNPQKTFLNFRNSLWMLAKNLPGRFFYPLILVRLMLDEVAVVRFFAQGKFREGLAVWRAHLAFFRRLYQLRTRYAECKALPASLYRGSIVAGYYLFGKKRFMDLSFRASRAK